MKKSILYIVLLLFSLGGYAQLGKINYGDRLYDKFDFVKAIEVYEGVHKKKPSNQHVNQQLANCYMLIRQPKKAIPYYKNIVKKKDISPEYYYAYAQALRSVGEYKKSEKWMKKYKASGAVDSRMDQFFENPDFIETIYNRKKTYELENSPLNTKFSDYGAVNHNDQTYFVSARIYGKEKKKLYGWNNQPFLDIYKVNDTSGNVEKLLGEINTQWHEGAVTFTPDGKYVYFTRNNYYEDKVIKDSTGTNNLKIFKAELIDGLWQNPRPLFFSSDKYSIGHPTVSADGKKFFFTSDMPGGYGGTDIYMCEIHDRGGLKKPVNLGPMINTEGNEMFPFYHDNENKLYFSSDGHLGLGQLDVFVADHEPAKVKLNIVYDTEKVVVSKPGKFSNVSNLGEPVNSIADDFAYNMDHHGHKGYVSSNREGGQGDDDIYTFTRISDFIVKGVVSDEITGEPLENATVYLTNREGKVFYKINTGPDGYYERAIERNENYQINAEKSKYGEHMKTFSSYNQEAYTEMVVNIALNRFMVKGVVSDEITGKPLENATIYLADSNGKTFYEVKTGPDGYYEKAIERNKNYHIQAYKAKFKDNIKKFDSHNQTKTNEMIVNISLNPLNDMNVLAGLDVDIIYFDFDSSVVTADAKPELDKIIAVMKKYKDMIVRLESHTDSRGSYKYNLKLSDRRAKATYEYLIANGINPERITSYKGYGEKNLSNDCVDNNNCDENKHKANRRTEFVIEKFR